MLSLIHEKLLEKKNKLETEAQTINNALEDLEKANIVYGVQIVSKGFGQDSKTEGHDFKTVFKECTEKFMAANNVNEINEITICWAYVDGVYVYIESGEYGDVIKKLGMEEE